MTSEVGATPIGRFSHNPGEGTWTWNDEVFRIHGLAPGSITPTTENVLESKHPEDRDRVAEALLHAGATGDPFSVSFRLLGADGIERKVVMVCEGGMCEEGAVTTIDGYYIDLTEDFEQEAEERARSAVAASAEHRATIEQAKGGLMLAYGLDPDQAFAMLRWWSRNRNVKVRDLAQEVIDASQTGDMSSQDLRQVLDRLFSGTAR